MQQVGYHRANMLAAQLHDDIVSRDTSVLSMVQELAVAATKTEPNDNPPQNQTVNTVSQDTMQLEMLRIWKDIQRNMQRTYTVDRTGEGEGGGNRGQ